MLSRKIFTALILASSFFTLPAAGQISRIEQDFVQWTQIAVDGNPPEDSDGFEPLGLTDRAGFADAVDAFLAEDWSGADSLADGLGYEVVAFRDAGNNGETYYGLIPEPDNDDSRGFYFVRPRAGAERRLVIEAPHAVEDERTGVFASEIFRATGARALLISGVDRCANATEPSGCSGSTDCGPHPISDMAHATETFFQVFHERAEAEHADTYVLQIHGFLADATGEPEFSVSDGSEANSNDPAYLPNAFYRDLQDRMEDVAGTPARNGNSCNEPGHQNFKCGTLNVQARFTNGSADACELNAAQANGQFIHLEMSNDLRDPLESGDVYDRQIVIDAVNSVFPRTASAGDRIWADLDTDGVQDPGEPGVHGAVVEILDGSGNVVESSTTIVGAYRIGNLDPGTYRVRVQLPTGYAYGSGLDNLGRTNTFLLAQGQSLTSVDAALNPPSAGEIGDFVWEDDGDGLQDTGEDGLPGIPVDLLTPEGDVVASTVTDNVTGLYSLENVLPGDYSLRFTAPSGQGFTRQVTGSPNDDSDVDPATGRSAAFSLASGVSDSSRDAGLASCLDVSLIGNNAIWKWKTGTSSWPSGWTGSTFDDSSTAGWEEGFSPLGFGDDDDFVTEIPNPEDTSGIFTTYFRLSFDVADATLFQQPLELTFTRDDGVIVYLNGVEVARRNLPWGAVVDAGTPASTEAETAETVSIPASLLASGTNVLAVELHQVYDPEEDEPTGLFDLSLTGKACSPCRIQEEVITSTQSTFLKPSTTARGSRTLLEMDGGSGAKSALVRYDLGSLIPANAEVLHAELLFHTDADDSGSDTDDAYAIHALERSWTESVATWTLAGSGVNWQTAGATGANDSSSVRLGMMPINTGNGVEVSTQLNNAGLAVIEQWADNPGNNFGFLIDAEPGSTNGIDVYSDDEAQQIRRPRLRVIYANPTCSQ